MLSVKSLGAADSGVAEYYEQLARDDYYEHGGEPPGRWLGGLADGMDMLGEVRAGQLHAMLQGLHPASGEALARNAGPQHKAGWDLTFSAPKSVSVLWGIVEPTRRAGIAAAHDAAVESAVSYLESRAFTSRDRQGESPIQSVLAAAYQHGTSRELDPQLHSHVLVANLGRREDGTHGALDFDTRYKMAAGAVYRAELAARLRAMGYGIERDRSSFRVQGVDAAICLEFSKRRRQIIQELQRAGFAGAKSSAIAALSTRRDKQSVNREALYESWRAMAFSLGLDASRIIETAAPASNAGRMALEENSQSWTLDTDAILNQLTAQASTFSRMQLEAAMAVEAQGGLSAQEFRAVLESFWDHRPQDPRPLGLVMLQPIGENHQRGRETARYTTREMLALERKIVERALQRRHERHQVVSCMPALAGYPSLSGEQREALRVILEEPGAVQSVRGLAGTGKSYLLRAAHGAWQRAGYSVLGAALSGKAADSLALGSGIPSQTLHSLLRELESGGKSLGSNSILIIDEAGMVGSRLLHRILERVHAAGAKAILVGDPRQLQPIEAGGMFRMLSEQTGHARLVDIRRQQRSEDRNMIHALLKGGINQVFGDLTERGLLEIVASKEIHEHMAARWLTERDPNCPAESLMLAGSKADVYRLNMAARRLLMQRHELSSNLVYGWVLFRRRSADPPRAWRVDRQPSSHPRNGLPGPRRAGV